MSANPKFDTTNYNYTLEQIEQIAEGENRKYDPSRLIELKPLDPHHYAETMLDVTFDFKYLSHNGTPQCKLFYTEAVTWVSSKHIPKKKSEKMTPQEIADECGAYEIYVKPRTIIVDQSILDKGYWFKEKFDILHECGHLILHPHGFSDEQSNYKPHAYGDPLQGMNLIEHHANRFAAALLMPRDITKTTYRDLMNTLSIVPQSESDKIGSVIEKMADMAKVSFDSMMYRLANLKLISIIDN